jgi:hypothetical protein
VEIGDYQVQQHHHGLKFTLEHVLEYWNTESTRSRTRYAYVYVICHTMYEHTIVSPGRSACSRSSEDVPSSNMHGAALAPLSR